MIIDHLAERKCDLEDLSPIQTLLKKLINGRKFLLVLDDVWDDNQGKWNALLMCLFACGAKGSSIIVTTRLPTVVGAITHLSAFCVINSTCNLKSLKDQDSWSLFEHYAFRVGHIDNEDLVAIGKAVVAKCKGTPLAIKAMGSLLNCQKKEFWILVRDSEIWQLEEHGETAILPALRLSYHHLPPVYRQCFAHCSVYPKDWILTKERLIYGWMANGFIQSTQGKEAEDVGDEIFNGLLQRSFFQFKYENKDTGVLLCTVHDLACSVTKNECSRMKIAGIDDVCQRVRHVSLMCNSPSPPSNLSLLLKSQSYIRTLIFLIYRHANISGSDLNLSLPTGLKHLRVLDLGGVRHLNNIPPWIGHLRLLKWLDLEDTNISSLPEFIYGLTNLQVLLLRRNEILTTISSSVGELKNLRCLDLSLAGVSILPESICTLSNLQTLKLEYCFKLEVLPMEMKNMKSLKNLVGRSL